MPSSLGIVASGEDVLNDAVLWLDASLSSVSGGKLTNLGKGGSALDAQFGSTTSTDTNDPLLLTHTGTNYLYLPGIANNNASAPDAAVLDIVGDIELVCRVALDDWTPATANSLIASVQADPNRRFRWTVQSNGQHLLEWWPTGSAASVLARGSVGTPAFVDGTAYWLKITLDVDNGASGSTATFSWAPDQSTEPTSWTTMGTPTGAGVTSIANVTAPLEIGGAFSGTVNMAAGRFYRAIVRNGIGGTTVFDADFTKGITSGSQTTFTESSSNAATVTINRATSGRKSVAVTRPTLLFGTDDYLEVADNDLLDFALADDFTVLAVIRQFGTPTINAPVVSKVNFALLPGSAGWQLYNNETSTGAKFLVSDTSAFTTAQSAVAPASGALNVMAGVRDVAADLLRTYNNGTASGTTTDVTTATSSNALPLRIGFGTGTAYNNFEFIAAAVFRRALTANEIATIVARYT